MKRYHHPMPLSRVTFALYVYAIHSIKMGKFMLAGGVPRFYSQDKAIGYIPRIPPRSILIMWLLIIRGSCGGRSKNEVNTCTLKHDYTSARSRRYLWGWKDLAFRSRAALKRIAAASSGRSAPFAILCFPARNF